MFAAMEGGIGSSHTPVIGYALDSATNLITRYGHRYLKGANRSGNRLSRRAAGYCNFTYMRFFSKATRRPPGNGAAARDHVHSVARH